MELNQLAAFILFQAAVNTVLAFLLFQVYGKLERKAFLRFWAWSAATTALHQVIAGAALLLVQPHHTATYAMQWAAYTVLLVTYLQPCWMWLAALSLRRPTPPAPGPWLAAALGLGFLMPLVLIAITGDTSAARTGASAIRHMLAAVATTWFARELVRGAAERSGRGVWITWASSLLYAVHYLLLGIGELCPGFAWHLGNPLIGCFAGVIPLGISAGILLSVIEEAQKSIRENTSIWDSTIEAMRLCDREGRIRRVNAACCQLFGLTREELLGRSSVALYQEQVGRQLYERLDAALSAGEVPTRFSFDATLWNGKRVHLDGSHTLVETRDGIGLLSVFRDNTEQRMAQQELAHATQLAQAASRAKSAFLANMSHEIRTPLSAALGLIQLLDREELPPQTRGNVELMRQAGEATLAVINDVLELSQIEAGVTALHVKAFDPVASSDALVGMLAHKAAAKGLQLRLETCPPIPAYVTGDAARIRQVLLNLLSNAIKFTDAGEILLRVETAAVSGQPGLRFSVADTGEGIPEHLHETIFRPFTQADPSASRRHGGSGLGLAISRHLVEQMGGAIELSSAPGRGSTFSFALPLPAAERPPELPKPAAVTVPPSAAQLKVLIAEDNAVNSKIAVRVLERFGVHPDVVSDGAQAVEATNASAYDLILMDVQMPNVDGLQATRLIRAREQSQPHIVALTAHVLPEDRDACLGAGMDDYLVKPIDFEAMAALLARLAAKDQQEPAPLAS